MNTKLLFSLTLLSTALLQACGGGGGDGGSLPPPASNTGPQQQSEPKTPPVKETPPDTQTPDTPNPPKDPYAPVAGSEPAPSLSAPQPGSTADVGSVSEGIYESFYGYTFISPTGQLVRKDLMDWTWGSITVTGLNWSFNADTRVLQSMFPEKTATGSGTFTAKQSMNGSISEGGRAATAWGPLTYSAANALAVTQDSLKGKWAVSDSRTFNMSIEFDATGAFTGTTFGSSVGVCSISGTAMQTQPGSAKNMYDLTLTAVNAATGTQTPCALDTSLPYAGPAGIVLTPAGMFVQNGYFRAFAFHAKTSNGAVMSNFLDKQK